MNDDYQSDLDAPAYEPKWYASHIDLPARSLGKMRVSHKIVKGSTPIVSMRELVTRGAHPLRALLKKPLRYHELSEDSRGVWMTDLPQELNQAQEALFHMPPFGKVLIGGLGLGILPAYVCDFPDVSAVTVVEISHDVIKLTAVPGRYKVAYADITEYLRICPEFDCYYLDTWTGTSETEWWDKVLPLRRIIGQRFGCKPIWCWAEDIMLGQCRLSAWRQRGRFWHYKILSPRASRETVRKFFDDIGLPQWERRYGAALADVLGEAETCAT